MVDAPTFHENRKCAEVTLVYKKKNTIAENNYSTVCQYTDKSFKSIQVISASTIKWLFEVNIK